MNKSWGAIVLIMLLSACEAEEPVTPPTPQYPILTRTAWEAKLEDLTGLIGEENCYPFPGAGGIPADQVIMEMRRYSGCKGFNVTADVPLEYWYLKELQFEPKEEVWLCVRSGRGTMNWPQSPHLVFEDSGNVLYPSDNAKLNLNMKIKVAQRDTKMYPKGVLPHFTYEEVGYNQGRVKAFVARCRLECIGENGEVKCHMDNHNGGIEWKAGADTEQYGSFVVSAHAAGKGLYDDGGGLHNSTWSIGLGDVKDGPRGNTDGIRNLPLPPSTGYLRWTIERIGFLTYYITDGDLWGMLINNVEITTTDASGPSM
ncbi:MAG: hypothetical protein LBT73_03125 [Tannerellaceae bacterium]|jgi:hypothetical protein|nr:hypothetical protein [Tannerellaceae bacterium]